MVFIVSSANSNSIMLDGITEVPEFLADLCSYVIPQQDNLYLQFRVGVTVMEVLRLLDKMGDLWVSDGTLDTVMSLALDFNQIYPLTFDNSKITIRLK